MIEYVDDGIAVIDGFNDVDELEIGDRVLDRFGYPVKVVGLADGGMREVWSVVLDDGRIVHCSPDSLWSYMVRDGLDTDTLRSIELKYRDREFYIPLCDVVEYPELDVPIHPYVMGCLLAGGRLYSPYVSIACSNPRVAEKIASLMEWDFREDEERLHCWEFYPRGMNHRLGWKMIFQYFADISIRYASMIRVPNIYKFNSKYVREEFLAGCLDAKINLQLTSKSEVDFSSHSVGMVDDVQHIACSLGRYCRKLNNRSLMMDQRRYASIQKIECCGTQGLFRDVIIDSEEHLYLNGDYVVVHDAYR